MRLGQGVTMLSGKSKSKDVAVRRTEVFTGQSDRKWPKPIDVYCENCFKPLNYKLTFVAWPITHNRTFSICNRCAEIVEARRRRRHRKVRNKYIRNKYI